MRSSSAQSVLPNRWVIAVAAFCMQLALGAVYAWSVFVAKVIVLYHTSRTPASLTFSLALVALGVTAGFGGYIVALAMLIKWFPDRRGFITGLAVAGFGGGAAITGPVAANFLLPAFGLSTTFIILGIAYLVIVVGAAQFFHKAPDGYAPPGWTPPVTEKNIRSARDYTLQEALSSPRWYVLWLILALNVTAGAALIAVASPLAAAFTGVTAGVAAALVITISIFNGAGRLFWGWLSDTNWSPKRLPQYVRYPDLRFRPDAIHWQLCAPLHTSLYYWIVLWRRFWHDASFCG